MAFIPRARYRTWFKGRLHPVDMAGEPPPSKEDPLIEEPAIRASTVAALAAVRRLSFAALHAATDAEIHCELASGLFTAFSVEQVHVSRLAQDGSVARGMSTSRPPTA